MRTGRVLFCIPILSGDGFKTVEDPRYNIETRPKNSTTSLAIGAKIGYPYRDRHLSYRVTEDSCHCFWVETFPGLGRGWRRS